MSEQVEPQTPSERQLALLRMVNTHVVANGYPPSRREIAMGVGVASIHTVQGLVDILIVKGLLSKKARISRSLFVTEAGRSFL